MTQSKALEILQSGHSAFLTGEPGSGKTYTIDQFRAWMQDNDKSYAITASTGIAGQRSGVSPPADQSSMPDGASGVSVPRTKPNCTLS